MIQNVKLENELDIITNEKIIGQIQNILNEYLNKIETMQDNMKIDDIIGAVYVYSEIYDNLVEKEKWNNIIKKQFIRIKECIEEDGLLNGMALFGGLCDVGLAVYHYSKKTGHYLNFWNKINDIILDTTVIIVNECYQKIEDLFIHQYDCIRGLSGILNYLIHVECIDNKEVIEDVLGYLIKLSENKLINGKIVPGWHIKNENQIHKNEKLKFKNGNFDFGVAHGIAGPLSVMSLACKMGYCIDGQKEAILSIVEEYERLATHFNNCTFWRGQYSFEDYLQSNQDTILYKNKMSWCYGSIGILRSLKLAGVALDCQGLVEQEQNNIYQIGRMKFGDYFLNSPIICHGYAGLMALFVIEFKEKDSHILKEKINELAENIVKSYNTNYIFGFKNTETLNQSANVKKIESFGNEFLYGASGVILSLISLLKADTIWEIHLLAK